MYMDSVAWWINAGLMNVINNTTYPNAEIYGSSFNGASTNIGTWINTGTIQFYSGGALLMDNSGMFYQCAGGIMNYIFGSPYSENYPDQSNFNNIALDGSIGFYFDSRYKNPGNYWTLFFWANGDGLVWDGSLSLFVADNTQTVPSSLQLCYDPVGTVGTAYLYPVDAGTCSSFGSGFVSSSNAVTGGVCSGFSDPVVQYYLSQTAPCSTANPPCGYNTGAWSSTGSPVAPVSSDRSGASTLSISFFLFITVIAYLYFSNFRILLRIST